MKLWWNIIYGYSENKVFTGPSNLWKCTFPQDLVWYDWLYLRAFPCKLVGTAAWCAELILLNFEKYLHVCVRHRCECVPHNLKANLYRNAQFHRLTSRTDLFSKERESGPVFVRICQKLSPSLLPDLGVLLLLNYCDKPLWAKEKKICDISCFSQETARLIPSLWH